MNAEKQHKEANSRVIQPSKGGGGHIVYNRLLAANNAKLIGTIQREPMELEEFKKGYKLLYDKYFALGGNSIHRFTSYPEEKIGFVRTPGDVLDQITGEAVGVKPLSFGFNLDALIATGLSGKGDGNIWKYASQSEYLCSINLDGYDELKKKDFIIVTGTSNELTVFETECVLGVTLAKSISLKEMKDDPSLSPYIDIAKNPLKGSEIPDNDSIQFVIGLINNYKPKDNLSKGIDYLGASKTMKWLETILSQLGSVK